MEELINHITDICRAAKGASGTLAASSGGTRNRLLEALSGKLRAHKDEIIRANTEDLEKAKQDNYPVPMLDRLKLNEARIDGICDAVMDLVNLPDPLGRGERTTRPNGLVIEKVSVPLGVVAVIYEARPNVTVDITALCLKTGNAVVLRGGKEALETNKVLTKLMKEALSDHGFSPDLIGFVEATSRESAMALMGMRDYVDVLIPRGGKGLIRSCAENSKIPLIETGAGNCHLYVDESADPEKALTVAVNAKCQRPSVCNAIETLLVHKNIAETFLPAFFAATRDYGLEIRADAKAREVLTHALPASDADWDTEYDDYIIAVRVVNSLDEAIAHINQHSTHHSEAIMTRSLENANRFKREVDSACVYVNASTRFTDGGEFGFGAEVGISVQKLHARGPMGLDALTTVKYLIEGDGQIRT